jgi:hypothetical protein
MLRILSQGEGLTELTKDWCLSALNLVTGGYNLIGLLSGFWPRLALSQAGDMWLLVSTKMKPLCLWRRGDAGCAVTLHYVP